MEEAEFVRDRDRTNSYGGDAEGDRTTSPTPGKWARLSRQVIEDGVANDVGVGPQPGLLEDMRAMRADGFDAEIEAGGNLADRLAGAEQAEDLVLPVREALMRQGGPAAALEHMGGDCRGHVRADIRPAGGDAPNRLQQFFRCILLLHVAGSAGAEGSNGKQLLGVHAQDQHGEPFILALDLLEQLDSATRSQGEVENEQVEGLRAEQGQQLIG